MKDEDLADLIDLRNELRRDRRFDASLGIECDPMDRLRGLMIEGQARDAVRSFRLRAAIKRARRRLARIKA